MLSARCPVCDEVHLLTSVRTMSVHFDANGQRCKGSVGFPDEPEHAKSRKARDVPSKHVPSSFSRRRRRRSVQLSQDHPALGVGSARCSACGFDVPLTIHGRVAPHRIVDFLPADRTWHASVPQCAGSELRPRPASVGARRSVRSDRPRTFAAERILPEADRSARPRVHEVAAEYGVSSTEALRVLRLLGELVRGPDSSLAPGVSQRLRDALKQRGHRQVLATAFALPPRSVMRAGDLMQRLPQSMPALIDLLTSTDDPALGRAGQMLRSAGKSDALFLVPRRYAHDLTVAARSISSLSLSDLPCPEGVSLQPVDAPGDGPASWRLLTWAALADAIQISGIEFVTRPQADHQYGLEVLTTTSDTLEFRTDETFADADGSLGTLGSLLAGMLDLVPVRQPPGEHSVQKRGSSSSAQPSRIADGVRLIYPTRSAATPGASRDSGNGDPRSSRWSVRGHWRQQWYRSRQSHERIWIQEHEAGANDEHTQLVRKVHIIAPRRSRSSTTANG
jgi:hypothetical protein